jgi:hypothetical protein
MMVAGNDLEGNRKLRFAQEGLLLAVMGLGGYKGGELMT